MNKKTQPKRIFDNFSEKSNFTFWVRMMTKQKISYALIYSRITAN